MKRDAPRRPVRTRNTGFWGWVERQVILLKQDPERRARAFRIAWYVSTAVVLLGFAIILYSIWSAGASAHATDAPGVVERGDVTVAIHQAGDAWTVHESVAFAGASDRGVHAWLPHDSRNLVLRSEGAPPDALSFVLEEDGLAFVSWPADVAPTSVTLQFVLDGVLPALVVPVDAGRLVVELRLADGYAPPGHEWRQPIDSSENVWVLTLEDVEAGASVRVAPEPPAPEGAPDVALVVVATSALVFAAGAFWSARRTPRLTEGASVGLLDHLKELQSRLLVVAAFFAVLNVVFFATGIVWRTLSVAGQGLRLPVPAFTIAESVSASAFRVIAHRFVPATVDLVVVRPIDAALTQLLVALFLAFLAVVPLAAWEMAAFLAPALRPKERSFLRRSVPAVVGLFVMGVAFAYFVMVPVTMRVLYSYAFALDATPLLAVNDLVGFAVILTLVFGLAFELPVVMVGLARVGVVKAATFSKYWRHAVVGIFVFAGVVTPDPTIVSMLLLAVPLTLLYVIGVAASRAAERRAAA